jgi:hypothetical protein
VQQQSHGHLVRSRGARFCKIIASAVFAVCLCVSAAEAAIPTLRHFTTAFFNSPEGLPALPEAPSVHYEPGASEQARRVAALLPAALARVSAVHGRPFAHPVVIGVYVSPEAFAVANGVGTPDVVGVTFMGRVTLSPVLFSRQPARLSAILTHELSHAHLVGWMGALGTISLPNWFKEGLAVMTSDGGGAEGVSVAEAREAIRRGDRIAINDSGSLSHLTALEFEKAPKIPQDARRAQMAYRQASLFVTYLRKTDEGAFTRMMQDIEQDRSFKDAVAAAYGANVFILWSRFIASCCSLDTSRGSRIVERSFNLRREIRRCDLLEEPA